LIVRTSAVFAALAVFAGACSLVPAGREPVFPRNAPVPEVKAAAVAPAATTALPSAPVELLDSIAAKRNHPPDGLLSAGSETVTGRLGTYCYGNTCADIGRWPPKSDLPVLVASNKSLEFRLRNGEEFVRWSARYGETSDDDRSQPLGQAGRPFDSDANSSPADEFSSASFDAPPAGDWVVFVNLELAGGDLSYAWNVTVMPDTATE
jgi:hypothetical protein